MLYIEEDINDGYNSKIAIVCTHLNGGAGTAANRLSKCLGCETISTEDYNIQPLNNYHNFVINDIYTNTYFTIYNAELPHSIEEDLLQKLSKYDYINIHWISGFISENLLNNIIKLKKKTIITCHDYWHFTGGCHYPAGCDKFSDEYGCYNCPQIKKDLQELNKNVYLKHLQKTNILQNENVYITAPSNFILKEISKALRISPNHPKLHLLRNPYKPSFDWDDDCKSKHTYNYILCAGSMEERRKGYHKILKAFTKLTSKYNKFKLHIISQDLDYNLLEKPVHKYVEIYHCKDHHEIEKIYQKGDYIINTSYEENWSNVLVEAGCYGCIPIVASNHGSAEYANKYDSKDFICDNNDNSIIATLIKSLETTKTDLLERQKRISKKVKHDHSYYMIKSNFNKIIKNINNNPNDQLIDSKPGILTNRPYYDKEASDANYNWLKLQTYIQNIITSRITQITQLDLPTFSQALTIALEKQSIKIKINNLIKPGVELSNQIIKLSIDSNTENHVTYYNEYFDITLDKGSKIAIEANNEGYYGIRSLIITTYIEPLI